MMSPKLLLDRIHSTDRNYITTYLFGKATRICLLDFIGANNYFITEFGAIWNREKVFPNKNQIVHQGWVPLVKKDTSLPIPWSLLLTTVGKIWWPVHQVLGWAFDPYTDQQLKYFTSSSPHRWDLNVSKYQWVDNISTHGLYDQWMRSLYGGDEHVIGLA